MLIRQSPRPLRQLVLCAAGALVLLAPSCGKDSPSDSTTPLPTVPAASIADATGKANVTVVALDNSYRPQYVKVSPGTKITFKNAGRNPHNVISVNAGQFTDIPTDKLMPGTSGTIEIPKSGEVPYYCSLHGTPRAGMFGRIFIDDSK